MPSVAEETIYGTSATQATCEGAGLANVKAL